jgi:hypothetical protein
MACGDRGERVRDREVGSLGWVQVHRPQPDSDAHAVPVRGHSVVAGPGLGRADVQHHRGWHRRCGSSRRPWPARPDRRRFAYHRAPGPCPPRAARSGSASIEFTCPDSPEPALSTASCFVRMGRRVQARGRRRQASRGSPTSCVRRSTGPCARRGCAAAQCSTRRTSTRRALRWKAARASAASTRDPRCPPVAAWSCVVMTALPVAVN